MLSMVVYAKVQKLTNDQSDMACWRITFGDEKIPETIIECIRHGKHYVRYHFQKLKNGYKRTVCRKIKSSDGKTMIDAAIATHMKSEYFKRGKAML